MASIGKIEPGRYEVRWRTPEGASRRKVVRGGPEQARRFARSLESAKDRGTYVDPQLGKQTVGVYANRWLDSVRGTLKPKTVASYESLIRSRIVPALGTRRLANLRPSDVQRWVGDMQAAGLSASRIRQAHVCLKQVLDAALRDGALGRNAASGVKLPRLEYKEAAYFEPQIVAQIESGLPAPYGPFGAHYGNDRASMGRSGWTPAPPYRSLAQAGGRAHVPQ